LKPKALIFDMDGVLVDSVLNDIYERDVSDVKGVRELAAELAKPHHAGPRFRVCSLKNDERKQ
jgi:beta-phosphoglucomutase-like phosphatase (HAD superfamily)